MYANFHIGFSQQSFTTVQMVTSVIFFFAFHMVTSVIFFFDNEQDTLFCAFEWCSAIVTCYSPRRVVVVPFRTSFHTYCSLKNITSITHPSTET